MEELKMNIYHKLQSARCRLQELNLKKSGNNKFAGYSYYELGDILPAINNINKELGLCTHITFNNEFATLSIIDADSIEYKDIVFTSPMSKANLKGAHDIQNLGAVETYQRRYLYMSAYEIVEHDAVDSSKGATPQPPKVYDVVDDAKTELQTKIDICNSLQELTDTYKAIMPADHKASETISDMFAVKKQYILEQLKGVK